MLKRISILILLFLFTAGIFALLKSDPFSLYPQREVTSLKEFETHGMRVMKKTWLRAEETDPYVVLENVNCRIRGIELDIPKKKYKRNFDVYVLLLYDTGSGFVPEHSTAAAIKKGKLRFFLPEHTYVQRLRINFFPNSGNSVKFASLKINPTDMVYPNTTAVLLTSVLFLILAFLFSVHSAWDVYARESAAALLVILSAGIPVMRSAYTGICLPAFALAFSVFLMLSSLIVFEGEKKDRFFLLFLLISTGLLSFFWIFLSPGGEGPDEGMRLVVAEYIHRYGVIPRGDDPEVRDAIWGFSYAYYPILPYMISGYLARAVELIPGITIGGKAMLHLSRSVNGVAELFTVWYVWKISGKLFRGSSMRYAFPSLVGFFPQLVFISTYVNTDCFAILSSAVIIWYWLKGHEGGWRIRDAAGLSVGLALCALSYYYCYGFILMSIPFVFISAVSSGKNRKETAKLAAIITGLSFLLAGWWFVRNLIIYNGDLFARNALNANAEIYAEEFCKPSNIQTPQTEGQSLFYMLFVRGWIRQTVQSFIAVFSTLTLYARPYVYRCYKLLALTGTAGLFLKAASLFGPGKKEKEDAAPMFFYLILFAAACIPPVLAVYYSYTADFQPQGRYALGALIPLLILISKGLEAIEEKLNGIPVGSKGTHFALQPGSAAAALSSLMMLNIFLDTVCSAYLLK